MWCAPWVHLQMFTFGFNCTIVSGLEGFVSISVAGLGCIK